MHWTLEILRHFQAFSGFEFFLLPSRVHARPPAMLRERQPLGRNEEKEESMNSRERCIAAIKGETIDRVPVFPLLMFFAQNRHGISYREFATNGRALADAQLNIFDKFPVDAITAAVLAIANSFSIAA